MIPPTRSSIIINHVSQYLPTNMFDKCSQKYVKQNQLVHSFEHMQAIHCRVPWLSNPIMTLSPKSNPTIIFFAKKKKPIPTRSRKNMLGVLGIYSHFLAFWEAEFSTIFSSHPWNIMEQIPWVFPMKDGGVPILIFSSNGSVSKPCTPGEHQNSW